MAFIKTIPVDQAEGLLADLYTADQKSKGYVPGYNQALSLHPEIYDAWLKLIGSVRTKMRLRRFELITFAAAMALECTYWMLAHGALLRKNFFTAEQIEAIVKDFRNADLEPDEVELMAFAQKVIKSANKVDTEDMESLRRLGLSDAEILDIVVVVTARSFFSKTLDALGVKPDDVYLDLEPGLIQSLAIGRPFPWKLSMPQRSFFMIVVTGEDDLLRGRKFYKAMELLENRQDYRAAINSGDRDDVINLDTVP